MISWGPRKESRRQRREPLKEKFYLDLDSSIPVFILHTDLRLSSKRARPDLRRLRRQPAARIALVSYPSKHLKSNNKARIENVRCQLLFHIYGSFSSYFGAHFGVILELFSIILGAREALVAQRGPKWDFHRFWLHFGSPKMVQFP